MTTSRVFPAIVFWASFAAASLAATPVVTWVKTFDTFQGQHDYAALVSADGGFVACYPKYSADKAYASLCVTKFGPAGNLLWEREYGERPADKANLYHNAAYDIVETADGFLVAGSRAVPHSLGAAAELWVLKLDKAGNRLWEASPKPKDGHSFPNHKGLAVRPSPDGGVLLGASCMYVGMEANLAVFKLDAGGGVVWEKRLKGSQPSSAGFDCAPDGTVIAAWGGDSLLTVARLDQGGGEPAVGNVTLPAGAGLAGSLTVAALRARADGGFFCSVNEDNGTGFLLRVGAGGEAAWVVKAPATLFRGVAVCPDGGIVAAATDVSTRAYRINLVRMTAEGKQSWRKAWAHPTLTGVARAATACPTLDGGYLVFGTVAKPGAGGGTWNVLLKTDGVGGVR